MVFTTQVFLFVFFPFCILFYLFAELGERTRFLSVLFSRIRLKELILILFGFGFYGWTCFYNVLWLIFYIFAVYIFSRCIEIFRLSSYKTEKVRIGLSFILLISAVVILVLCWILYKYFVLKIDLPIYFTEESMDSKKIMAPIGLSFITFSAISYLVDIYRGKGTSGSLIDCVLFLSFFPKVISGPIVLWQDFQKQVYKHPMCLHLYSDGVQRIMIGFLKKVILADNFYYCLSEIGLSGIDSLTALGTLVLYTLYIYYDFSGYSDIAIGLAKLFGFEFKENFNFPYRSRSVSEFWRRWHISLGGWFREYVYFPLGGSYEGLGRTLLNLFIVFVLTGIWHGTGWNYLVWGLCNAVLVIIERVVSDKTFYRMIPDFLKCSFTMLAVMLMWQLFRFQNFDDMTELFRIIIGTVDFVHIHYTWQYYYDIRIIVLVIVGILGATVWGCPKVQTWYEKFVNTFFGLLLRNVVLLFLFFVSICFVVSSEYSPFIYFQY